MIEYLGDKTPEDVIIAAENITAISGHQVRACDIIEFATKGKPTPAIIAAARVIIHMRRFLRAAGLI